MSRYLINDNVQLRSFKDGSYFLMKKDKYNVFPVTMKEYCILNACDGSIDLPDDSPIIKKYISTHCIHKSESEEERVTIDYQDCPNRHAFYMTLEITDRCNYNCLHCFNAAGTETFKNEMPLEKVLSLLDQAALAGVHGILITGGEPLLHRDFFTIYEAVYQKGMIVYELNTNGSLITPEFLDRLSAVPFKPTLKISFDGIGFHDKMRGVSGSEERTIHAISLAIEKGFKVRINMNVNQLNSAAMLPSILMLDKLGVFTTRIIRTTEAPRWEALSNGATLSWSEYYELAFNITREYLQEKPSMNINFWQFVNIYPGSRKYYHPFIQTSPICTSENAYLCNTVAGNLAVTASGTVVPCMQMSGALSVLGKHMENIFELGIGNTLDENSEYSKISLITQAQKKSINAICRDCPYWEYCGGGCPAISLLTSNEYCGCSKLNCIFFRDNWPERVNKLLAQHGFKSITPLPDIDDGGYLDNVQLQNGTDLY